MLNYGKCGNPKFQVPLTYISLQSFSPPYGHGSSSEADVGTQAVAQPLPFKLHLYLGSTPNY